MMRCLENSRDWSRKSQDGRMSGVVHTGVEVRRMDSEMSRLVEQPWL